MVPALLCSSKRDPWRPSCALRQRAGWSTSAAICSTLLSQKLKRQSTKYRSDKIYPTAASEQPENVKKNRYKDILPCRLEMAHVPTEPFVFSCFSCFILWSPHAQLLYVSISLLSVGFGSCCSDLGLWLLQCLPWSTLAQISTARHTVGFWGYPVQGGSWTR